MLEISELILNVQNLEKTYVGGVHAVRGVSFEVNKGESIAIIGSSGSGKSTVLRCINRLIEPTKGIIKLRGEQINTPAVDINEVRSKIGMVFQSFELFSHLRVIDNGQIFQESRQKKGLKGKEGCTGQTSPNCIYVRSSSR